MLVRSVGYMDQDVNAASYRGVRLEVVSLRSITSDRLFNVSGGNINLDGVKVENKRANRSQSNGYTYRPLTGLSVMEEEEVVSEQS